MPFTSPQAKDVEPSDLAPGAGSLDIHSATRKAGDQVSSWRLPRPGELTKPLCAVNEKQIGLYIV